MLVYVGTYTRSGGGEGICVYRFDLASGALEHVQTVSGVDDPSYLALDRQELTLYAVNERADGGAVSALAVDPRTGKLTFLNRVASRGANPAHLSLDSTGRSVLVANYSGGTLAVLPVAADGQLGEATDVVHHAGQPGPNPVRQQGPHPHMIAPDPGGGFILVTDLGLDAVLVYRLDLSNGRLVAQHEAGAQLRPGAGPRHLAFHPNGRIVYVINELDSTVTTFAYDPGTGALRGLQTVSTLPAGFAGANTTAAIVVAPSGRFVFGSNRGHDSVATFRVDPDSAELALVGHTPTHGRVPRDVNVDPTGAFLLAANQDSDSIVTFASTVQLVS